MRSFIVFLQKEWMELVRTKKLLILLCIFTFLGISTPVITRYMQDIVRLATNGQMDIPMPTTTWVDSWVQLYGYLSQVGGICVILLFMNGITGEKQSGSAALTLTKNLSHTGFVMAKFISAAIMLFASVLLTAAICYGYTYFLFGFAGNIVDIILGAIVLTAFMLTLLGFTMFASALTKSVTTSAILAVLGFIILPLLNFLPGVGGMMPGVLSTQALGISVGEYSNILPSLLTALCISILCLFGAVSMLKRQEL